MYPQNVIFFVCLWAIAHSGVPESGAVSYSYISRPTDHQEHLQPILKKTISPSIIYSSPIEKPSYISHGPSIIHSEPTLNLHGHQHQSAVLSKVPIPSLLTHQVHIPTIRKEINVIPSIHKVIKVEKEHHEPANYEFGYSVEDHHTGDVKKQHEVRKEDQVWGSYSLVDPDGFKRTVEYVADEHTGFHANVRREPIGKVVAKVPVQKGWNLVQQGWNPVQQGWSPVEKGWSPVQKGWTPVQKGWSPIQHGWN